MPREPDKLLTNPLVSELAREIELVRFLKAERCFPRVETEPIVADKPCEKLLTSKAEVNNEPVSIRKRATFLAIVADMPSDMISVLLRPLDCDERRVREPLTDLKSEECSAN